MDEKINTFSQSIQCDTKLWTRPFKCAVTSCKNVFTKYDPQALVKYHNFPTNLELQRLWLQRCHLQLDFPGDTTKVCTLHFLPNDYETTTETNQKVLRSTAIPSQFLNDELIVENDLPQKLEIQNIIDENVMLRQTYNEILEENKLLVNNLSNLEKRRFLKERKLKMLSHQYEKLKKCDHSDGNKNLLSQVLTRSQINVLLNKKRVVWSNDDMAKAFTLRQMGNRECYLYLKRTLNFPLPSLSSVQKWTASK